MARAALKTYRSKRDFTRTSEPSGKGKGKGDGFFIVQKHAARALHYDFRLAHNGVLLSWAVTKGPSMDPADKRLAVHVEDHPIEYADFEGTIPRGQYGGGTVMLWDRGPYRTVEDLDAGLKDGKIKIELDGERLKGGFALVRMRPRKGEKRENWLLIKEQDEKADSDWQLDDETTSVSTGRSMDEISKGDAVWKDGRKQSRTKRSSGKAKLPEFVKPQLATLVEAAPDGDDWLHEVKYDGYRLIAAVDGGDVRLYTRSGRDWTDRFSTIAEALAKLDLPPSLLDGEVIASNGDGKSDFSALQKALTDGTGSLAYFVFDLLVENGRDIREKTLRERKGRLERLIGRSRGRVRYSDHVEGAGDKVATRACRLGYEGIVSKRADAPYRSTRGRSWLKTKCVRRQEFVIGGWSPSDKKGRPFSSLLVGVHENGALRYAGRVGSGFDMDAMDDLAAKLKTRARKTSPFGDVPGMIARKARWATPDLVAEIAFAEFTREGHVRHGVFLGLREDKPAGEITIERPKMSDDRPVRIAGVDLSSPGKVLFPAMGITKRDLAAYFEAAADRMLPHLEGRPVSLVRCPEGREGSCFFQKHVGKGMPKALTSVAITEKDGDKAEYLLVDSPKALVSCAQIGALELHVWGSRKDAIEKPDRIVFDLDPGDGVPFSDVKKASKELAGILAEGGLTSFPLVTGGKGVHIVVPVDRRHEWPAVSAFAKAFADKIADLDPDRFVANMSKARRGGKIFLDYLRNQRGSTAIAPYSPRAREGAPVAIPVTWDELAGLKAANVFSLADALARLKEPDPWTAYADTRQSLGASKLKKIGLEDALE